MARMPHTATKKGKRVHVILKSGEKLIDHFEGRTDRHVFLRARGRIAKSEIRAFSDYRAPPPTP